MTEKGNKTILSIIAAILIVGIVPTSMAVTNTNSGHNPVSVPAKIGPQATTKILVYADDAFHVAPNTYIDQALKQLGLSYTAYYNADFTNFNTALTTGSWDLVIFGQEEFMVDASTLNNLSIYVNGGGKLIAESWNMGNFQTNPLWATMGVSWVSDDTNPPDPVFWWSTINPIVSGLPNFNNLIGNRYGIYGQHVNNLGGTTALGGYTTSPGADAALVLRNDGKTLFRGFMDGQNDADSNGNGIPDGVELWKKSISFMMTGGLKPMVFIRGTDNGLWYRTYDGTTFGPWTSLGGIISSDPEASTWFNKIFVFARGQDNSLWYRSYDGTNWSPWTSLGGVINSGAGAS